MQSHAGMVSGRGWDEGHFRVVGLRSMLYAVVFLPEGMTRSSFQMLGRNFSVGWRW
jgi:hypothetical protein